MNSRNTPEAGHHQENDAWTPGQSSKGFWRDGEWVSFYERDVIVPLRPNSLSTGPVYEAFLRRKDPLVNIPGGGTLNTYPDWAE